MMEKLKEKLREGVLNMSGYVLWPPQRPDVKGPQPRLISREQLESMRKMADETKHDDLAANFE